MTTTDRRRDKQKRFKKVPVGADSKTDVLPTQKYIDSSHKRSKNVDAHVTASFKCSQINFRKIRQVWWSWRRRFIEPF